MSDEGQLETFTEKVIEKNQVRNKRNKENVYCFGWRNDCKTQEKTSEWKIEFRLQAKGERDGYGQAILKKNMFRWSSILAWQISPFSEISLAEN